MQPFALVSNRKSKNTIMENSKGETATLTLPLESRRGGDNIDINEILNREQIFKEITDILNTFEKNCKNVNFKKGIYIYGSPGCGKTRFVLHLLSHLNYDIIKYDAGDIRNKTLIDNITCNNISTRNVLEMMNGKVKKIAIMMDEIDGMNNGDKGGITSLIKLIRQKKTKKQKLENVSLTPIICIGNYCIDKKIKELMKVCNVFELKTPTRPQIKTILERNILLANTHKTTIPATVRGGIPPTLMNLMLDYIQGDLLKLDFIVGLYNKNPELLNEDILTTIFKLKSYNYDAKKITREILNSPKSMENHTTFMNDTDRTIVGLLYHENIVDSLDNVVKDDPKMENVACDFYLKTLDNICYADYIDRITFQNQIWIFNELSSMIKTFYNNHLFHETFKEFSEKHKNNTEEVRFTKVLTKYSTEYNNQLFINNLCQELNMDKKDTKSFFQELRMIHGNNFYNNSEKLNIVMEMFDSLNISKLVVKRMYRFLDKNVKTETDGLKKGDMFDEDDDDDDADCEEMLE